MVHHYHGLRPARAWGLRHQPLMRDFRTCLCGARDLTESRSQHRARHLHWSGRMARDKGWLLILAGLSTAACLDLSEPEPADEIDLYAGAVSRIRDHEVYVRWAPGSATIDYFLKNDMVDVHGTSRHGRWACVTGVTRSGLKHTGWVIRSAIDKSSSDSYEGTGRCKYGPDDLKKFEVTFTNCRIRARGAFRKGPDSGAERSKGPRAPDGFLDPGAGRTCVARASNSQGGTREAVKGHVWVAWRPDKDPNSNKAPGRTGWFREDLLDCSENVSCRDDVGAVAATAAGGSTCGDGECNGDESDETCASDCGCAALDACVGPAPFGCYCDATCGQTGDCCADVAVCVN
jgi:hypothetical protein